MEIKDFDYNLEFGFAHIVVEDLKKDSDLTVQCCLISLDNDGEYVAEIEMGDCGHDDGICGDVNNEAFKQWGENRCMKALFAKAKEAGIKLI